MEQQMAYCLKCDHELRIADLACKKCGTHVTGDFKLSKFDLLSSEEQRFILLFLENEGNFRRMQEALDMSYASVRRRLEDINLHLSYSRQDRDNMSNTMEYVPVESEDSEVVCLIKQRMNEQRGRTIIPLYSGKPCVISLKRDGTGLQSPDVPDHQLDWPVFDAVMELLWANGGQAKKGNARNGKLGSISLPIDSVEGYIAKMTHHVPMGKSALSAGFLVCAVLDWIGVCKNGYGYLSLRERSEVNEKSI